MRCSLCGTVINKGDRLMNLRYAGALWRICGACGWRDGKADFSLAEDNVKKWWRKNMPQDPEPVRALLLPNNAE